MMSNNDKCLNCGKALGALPILLNGTIPVFCSKGCAFKYFHLVEMAGSKVLTLKISVYHLGDSEVDGNEDSEAHPKMPFLKKIYDWEYEWKLDIDIDTGKIADWPVGITAKTYYKVSDQLELFWMDRHYKGYVPKFLQIFDNGFDDYIHIEIDGTGQIVDWNAKQVKEWLNNAKWERSNHD